MLSRLLVVAATLLLAACGGSSSEAPTPTPTPAPEPTAEPTATPRQCEGSSALCDRRFDEVAWATTHNAYSNEEDGFIGPNQRYNVPRQLADGVRGLMLDVYLVDGVVTQCHSLCDLGSRALADTLAEIATFLDENPDTIVSIIFESYVDGETVAAEFDAAGLTALAHVQDPDESWPTLAELLDAGSRLVVFTDRDGLARPWYLPVWDHAFETHYSFEAPEDLDCAPNRGDTTNPLFIVNHFLTRGLGSPTFAEMVNYNPLLEDRVSECAEHNDAFPNFITVDFHDIGDVLKVTDAWNE